jgi:hypothetical protein
MGEQLDGTLLPNSCNCSLRTLLSMHGTPAASIAIDTVEMSALDMPSATSPGAAGESV